MKNKKLTALILCITMLFSITSGIFSAAFASDGTTGSAYSLDTTTGSAYKVDKGPMLFSTKAATSSPSSMDYSGDIGKTAVFDIANQSSFLMYNNPSSFDYEDDWSNDNYWLNTGTNNKNPDVTTDNVMVIVDYYWDEATTALWYQVEAADGSSLPAKMIAGGYDWLFQDYTDPNLACGDVLILYDPPVVESMVGKTVQFKTDIDPSLYASIGGTGYGTMSSVPNAMIVIEQHTDENGVVWYYVDAVEGETWPADYAEYHYVKATDVIVVEQEEDQVQLSSGGITISGEDIPEGAKAVVFDLTETVNPGDGVNIFDISVQSGETNWQPEPGKTVKVTLPAPVGAETVNVFHFLEDPEIIKYALEAGIAYEYDVSGAVDDKNYFVMENAVKAYQEAFNTTDICVAIEVFGDVGVEDGLAEVDANGFSAFELNGTTYDAITPNFTKLTGTAPAYYVRPGELIVGNGFSIWEGFGVIGDSNHYVSFIENDNDGLLNTKATYFTVSKDATDGYKFGIKLGTFYKTVEFTVRTDLVIDKDNVRIFVLPQNTAHPVEPAIHSEYSNIMGYYLQANDSLNTNNYVYTTTLSDLIDRTAVLNSGDLKANTPYSVYGIVDDAGVKTRAYLSEWFNDYISKDILTNYCMLNALNESEYQLIVYAVKYEAVGDNMGWYINCKVIKKDSFTLSYEYNLPSDANELDHIIGGEKPAPQTIYADDDGNYITTVQFSNPTFSYSYEANDQQYTGTFLGWDTDPNATVPMYKSSDANKTIILTENTVLYAIWESMGTYSDADVKITKKVIQKNGTKVDDCTATFNFTADSKFNGRSYTIHNENGVQQSKGKFGATPTFDLENGWYIIVKDVPNDATAYVITESVITGYTPQEAPMNIAINTTTNKTGSISKEFVNVVHTHTVTWDVDGVTTEVPYNYGATIVPPTAPTKEGYTFTGWSGYTAGMTMPDNDVVFVAQWQVNSVDLTIKTVVSNEEQSFIFNVDGTAVSGEKIKLSVVLVGNDVQKIVNLPAGTYTVSNQQGWSWRYNTVSSQEATIYSGSEVMEFSFGTPSKIYWLDGNAWRNFFFNE